jgi:hypothetical protein
MTLPLYHLKHVFRRLLRTPLFTTIALNHQHAQF